MKKFFIFIASISIALSAYCDSKEDIAMGFFHDIDGSILKNEAMVAFIVDTTGNNFENFTLQIGDSFSAGSFLNTENEYMTLLVSSLASDGTFNSSIDINNTSFGFTGGENVAVVCYIPIIEGSYTETVIAPNVEYTVFNPSKAGGELSGGHQWVIPVSNSGTFSWNLLTTDAEGSVPISTTTLDSIVVPEPAALAAIFGALALGLALVRRKRN